MYIHSKLYSEVIDNVRVATKYIQILVNVLVIKKDALCYGEKEFYKI